MAAALLHDVLEDTDYSVSQLKKEFGAEVAFLVDGVTKLDKINHSGLERDIESLRKFVIHLSQDVRVILVRLADRYHNMKTLYIMSPDDQRRIALETMEVYSPLAYRLGMFPLAGELEDLAFPYIYPQEYKWLIKNVKDLYEARVKYADGFHKTLNNYLTQHGIADFRIESRAKRYTSLYRKLLRYDMDISKVHDLVALRVITKTKDDCYKVLKLIHAKWPPFSPIQDYIKKSKPNGYQSIHTEVFGPQKKNIEIQIRDEKMHQEAELGIAAHFAYHRLKETPAYALGQRDARVNKTNSWIRRLLLWRASPKQSSTVDIFKDQLLVLSPKKDIIELPKEATALDFAYKIHEEIGHRAVSAKRNNASVPLSAKLEFGDIVEIITSKTARPRASWLKIVKTRLAQNKIKAELDRLTRKKLAQESAEYTEFIIWLSNQAPVITKIKTIFSAKAIPIERISLETRRAGVLKRATAIVILCRKLAPAIIKSAEEEIKKIKGVRQVQSRSAKKQLT